MSPLRRFLAAFERGEVFVDRKLKRPLAGALLVVIVAGACGLAVVWAFLVPIYQGPDEIVIDDYSFSLFQAGRLFNARELPPGPAAPYTTYLADRTGAERIARAPLVKAPPGYGTKAYYADLEALKPVVARPFDRVPFLVTRYPVGYFAVVAIWLGIVSVFAGTGPVTLFFAARLLSVVMLAGSLALTYGTARELRVSRLRSLLLTAAIGFFPMTSFVASYAQIDNLVWLLVAATLYLALAARRRPSLKHPAAIGLVLGLLLITKYQFFVCTAIPVAALLAMRRQALPAAERRLPAVATLLVTPVLALGALQYWIGYGSPYPLIGSTQENTTNWTNRNLLAALHAGPVRLVRYVTGDLVAAFRDFWAGGPTFKGFWGVFGWSDTDLVIRSRGISAGIRGLLLVLTLALLLLAAWRIATSVRRLWRLRQAGHGRAALAVVAGNPVVGSHLLFVLFMFAFFVYADNSFFAQGRNWLPFILAVFLVGILIAPRALPLRTGRTVSGLLLVGLLLYSAVASHYALTSVQDRFYGNGRSLVAATLTDRQPGAAGDIRYRIDYLAPSAGLPLHPGEPLAIGGWAGSSSRPDGVLTVFVSIDGTQDFEAVYGDSRDDVVAETGNPNFARAGFDLIVPTGGLSIGAHMVSIKIVPRDQNAYFQPPDRLAFSISGG